MSKVAGQVVQVITTIDSEAGARAIARLVVESHLAACAQVYGPLTSVYWWQGRVEETTEWACLCKTLAANYDALERLIKAHHPYTVPEILAVPVSAGNPDYLNWLGENATPGTAGSGGT